MNDLTSPLQVRLSQQALKQNYLLLSKLSGGRDLIPMVKADGYGHGAQWVAQHLPREKLYALGVAALQEAAELRASSALPIMVFSGSQGWSENKAQFFAKHSLIPVIQSWADWKQFLQLSRRQPASETLPFHLKFNTGMNRLGIPFELASEVLRDLKSANSLQAHGLFSHLAMAESAQSPVTRRQLRRFQPIAEQFLSAFPKIKIHLSNSAAIWNEKALGLRPRDPLGSLLSLCRPGISLYGIRPWKNADQKSLKPVMSVECQVIEKFKLLPGESVGYSATFQCSKNRKQGLWVGILSAGYADGLSRALSNSQGWLSYGRKKLRLLGIVSMDLTAVEIPATCPIGSRIQILGANVDPWQRSHLQAIAPYELLTFYGSRSRIERLYD